MEQLIWERVYKITNILEKYYNRTYDIFSIDFNNEHNYMLNDYKISYNIMSYLIFIGF